MPEIHSTGPSALIHFEQCQRPFDFQCFTCSETGGRKRRRSSCICVTACPPLLSLLLVQRVWTCRSASVWLNADRGNCFHVLCCVMGERPDDTETSLPRVVWPLKASVAVTRRRAWWERFRQVRLHLICFWRGPRSPAPHRGGPARRLACHLSLHYTTAIFILRRIIHVGTLWFASVHRAVQEWGLERSDNTGRIKTVQMMEEDKSRRRRWGGDFVVDGFNDDLKCTGPLRPPECSSIHTHLAYGL